MTKNNLKFPKKKTHNTGLFMMSNLSVSLFPLKNHLLLHTLSI